MYEMQVLMETSDGKKEWRSIRPSSCNIEGIVPPYRYDRKDDAKLMIRKLYPDCASEELRVISV